ncbi:MFS transporter [Blastococcus sp. TBT05-19]|uniref:MFS transporter n=1 Tax=Blastococcus sp. TBT05-19 TaxID=2250581 RepID=UPI000DE88AE0|nr:MFS transporter [Blastococcus sp. TBT05-19]RBY92098.1 MFS transporter [Blastococcus sp. TBT05-19]
MAMPRALAPLRHPAYRVLAAVLVLALLTQGLWAIAMVWQVVALGGDPGSLSLVAGLNAGGMLGTTLVGGALADRVPQRLLLLTVSLLQGCAVSVAAVLSLTGVLEVGHLAVVALVDGVALGLFYPAYSALVPALVPEGDLLAVNGLEGAVRPVLGQAAGPALAGLLVAAYSPGAALAVTAAVAFLAAGCALALPATPVRRKAAVDGAEPGLLADVREGFRYMLATRWLLTTLLFAAAMTLVFMGPLEVLVPFAIADAGGGPSQHAWVLAAFGIGGALGSLLVASLRLPRRYLTVMNLLWGVGCLPMVAFGLTTDLGILLAATAVVGGTLQAGMVIWGTLLQRRVPPALLGRVSSLDFFVSLSLMPLSMALAGPLSQLVGLTGAFLVAGLAPLLFAVVAIAAGRLPADELAHPLDVPAAVPVEETPAPPAAWMGADGAGNVPAREGEPWPS